MKSCYVTFDNIDINSGAGKVCFHEVNALARVTDCHILTRKDIPGADKYEFNPFLYDYFASQILSHGIDLLHLSCSPGLAILEKVKPRLYVVNIVAHDLQISIDEHELFYGQGSYPFKHNTDPYLHTLLLRHAIGADVIFTPSSTSADWINKNIPNRKRVIVIPHGTEIPDSYLPLPDKFVAGYLGASGPDKGLGYMLSAWEKDPTGEMILGGTCCQSLAESLKLVPARFPNVKLLGWLDKVSDFYNQISIYIQPSVTEGFGIEILEAMAYGRPVIASRGAGGADVISEGIDGFVVPPRNIDAMATKIKWFRDNPRATQIMGQNAREKAKHYTWNIIENRYEKVYSELLK